MPSQAPGPVPAADMPPPEAQAWTEFCRRLEALGTDLLSDAFSQGDRTELFAHMADQAVCWLGWEVFHADPRRPFFHRQNDLVTQWGGPNADNAYRHARIHPRLRYRIRGQMHSCEDFILAARGGFMHNPVWGTVQEVTASDLGIGRGDDFELYLGGDGSDIDTDTSTATTTSTWVPLPDTVQMVSIREYYFDWQAGEPATFTIECLDAGPASPPVTGVELAARLSRAADQTEQSMHYWNTYQQEQASQRVANSFAASQRVAKGLSIARYAFCFYSLGEDEALVIESDLPDARYWSFQIYTLGGFEPVDAADRITSLNHVQATVGDDGRVQVVVAHVDPGTENWLDTGGRREGMLIFRWFWPTGDGMPAPSATVTAFDAIDATKPAVTAEERATVMAARRAHLAWRFRV